jgi:hypothetical protein
MPWEKWVASAATVAGGLGISAWLIYLDYRRRDPAWEVTPFPASRGRRLNAGLGLAALALLLRWWAGTDRGWVAALSYAAALAGMALVASRVTGLLSGPGEEDADKRKGRKAGGCG